MQPIRYSLVSPAGSLAALIGLAALGTLPAPPALAACTTSGNTTTCNTNSPNPATSVIGSGPNTASGASVTLQPNAQLSTGNNNAISLGDNATITLDSGAIVRNAATSGSGSSGNGLWNAGKNTIEFGSNGTLTVGSGAQILSTGTSNNAEAVNVMGVGNIITNYGLISGSNGAAIWFEDRTTGGSNTVDNYGTIQTGLGTNSNVIGNNSNGNVNFINESGAVVNGSLSFAAGNDTLTLFPNSTITGGFNGGGGTNTLVLNGAAGSSDTLAGNILNFQTLTKTGQGTWTLSGSVGNNGGNAALNVEVQDGTLALTGNNSNFQGSVVVDAAGVLEARAQSLPPSVTDNGLVRFVQDTAGTFAGTISGTGSVEKTLGGTLTLTGTNTYSGGTIVNAGEVVISSDANLGDLAGSVTLNGGALGSTADVTLTRTVTLGPLGGGYDIQAGTFTDTGLVTGSGTLTKTGAGTLALTGANNYTGDTIINQGTVQVSSDANLGAGGNLQFDGGTLSTTADMTTARNATLGAAGGTLQVAAGTTLTDSGVFSGTGTLYKTGDGTLSLTAVNTQTGGTSISGGVMIVTNDAQLGDPSAPLQFDGGTLVAGSGATPRPTIINSGGATIQLDGDPLDPAQYLTVSGPVSGSGGFTKTGSGTLIYSGDNSYTGPTTIAGGFFYLNGDDSAQTGTITAQSGTRLAGIGTIGGSVVVQDGATIGPGFEPGTPGVLTINGDLNLAGNSTLLYNLVEANTAGGALNDLTVVHGNLTLDGTINVLDQGQTFGPGVYRIINYDGTLTDNGLTVGSLVSSTLQPESPLTGFTVQTAIPGQVNLINTTGLTLNYWDGDAGPKNNSVIDGGNGTWRVAGAASTFNWTGPDGAINAPWANGQFAVFAGTAGTVAVDNGQGQVQAAGMQFVSDGYLVQGATLELVDSAASPGTAIIRVGDGTARASTTTATIATVLSGGVMLDKTDLGTLILTAANSYTGGTRIDGGAVQISADANLGAGGTGVALGSGTLITTADIATARPVTLDAGGGTFQTAPSTTLELDTGVTGTGGLTKSDGGTLILAADSSYAGGTVISGGTLQAGTGGTAGSVSGDVANDGILVFNRSDTVSFGGAITGSGAVVQQGAGTTILTADSSYSGGTTIAAGVLQLGNGGASGSITGDALDNGTLVFDRSDTIEFDGTISGTGGVTHAGSGTTLLTANNSYAGPTQIAAGRLYIDGDQSAATGAVTVANGARLGGNGTVGGSVTIADGGTLAPGREPGNAATLTINGDLNLNPNSVLFYNVVEANVVGGARNDLTVVNGNLVLDGTINVLDENQTLGAGIYRLINYSGTLTDNGLNIGYVTPDGTTVTSQITGFSVQTAIPGQVNLVNTSNSNFTYWDAAGTRDNNRIDGGDGVWNSPNAPTPLSNFTNFNGTVDAPWATGGFAIFSSTPGTVTVDASGGPILVTGMQFASDGYLITGDPITLAGPVLIRVGDGTTLGADITATINSVLTGSTGITKTDLGTLILTADNAFRGGVTINDGVVQISRDANLGLIDGRLILNGGALRTAADIDTARNVRINSDGGTIETMPGTTLTLRGTLDGMGLLTKTGDGTLLLATDATFTGGTTIGAGILQLGDGGATGSVTGDITDNAILAFDRSDTYTYAGIVSGTGTLVQAGTGTTILTGENTYTGITTVSAGTLQIGGGGTAGSITGDVTDNAALAFNRADTAVFAGTITGTGAVVQAGTGTTVLTADSNYGGGTTIAAGTLQLGDGGTTGSITGTVTDNGTLAFNRSDTYVFTGVIHGTGNLVQTGTGTLIMAADSDYSGGTSVLSGTFQVGQGGTTGSVTGDILNNGTVIVDRSDDLVISSVMSGTGRAIQAGTDTIRLTGNNTYTGGTVVASGTLIVGDGATSGAILGDVEDNAVLAFDRSDSLLMNGVISGTGTLDQRGTGTTVLGGDNTYTGGTTVSAGTLQIGNGDIHGSVAGDVVDNAILSFSRSDTYTFSGVVSGSGQLVQAGPGTLILTATNTYTGGTAIEGGVLQISRDDNLGGGTLHIGGATLAITGDVTNTSLRETVLEQLGGTFAVPAGITLTNDGPIQGAGGFTLTGGGTMVLGGGNTYAGPAVVAAGVLRINGDQSGAAGPTSVQSGATLGGSGIIGGDVTVEDGGTLAPGNSPGTLTINGGLTLNPGSVLAYEFGAANVVGGALNDQTVVGGAVVLDGTINVTQSAGGSFDPGIYRVITYSGALTDNGLEIGTLPAGTYYVQTSIAGQVNLINTTGLTLDHWDGAAGPKNSGTVDGGDGVWQGPAGNDNWTIADGSLNAPFTDAATATFEGAPGTVTVDASLGAVNVAGMDFAVSGYVVKGDAINLAGSASAISVDNAGDTAEIDAVLAGAAALVKTGPGTLILGGANTYGGGTDVTGGVLQISSDANLGAAAGGLALDGGALASTASFATARAVTLGAGGGVFDPSAGTALTINAAVSGAGALTVDGPGTLILAGDATQTGGTTIAAGTLQIGNGGASGSLAGDVTDNGILVFDRSDTLAFGGVVSGTGNVAQSGSGTTVLTASQTYTGSTSVNAGTLAVGDAAHAAAALTGGGPVTVASGGTLGGYGSVIGSVTNTGTIAVADAVTAFAGQGQGSFTITGTLTNAGTAKIGGAGVGNQLIAASYAGQNGQIAINATVNGDDAPSDRLVVNGGTASGHSTITVTNIGGLGGVTNNSGIQLVEARAGATTASDAFTLGSRVIAGPYEYTLFRGARDGSSPDSWYLRTELTNPPVTDPQQPGAPEPPFPPVPPPPPPDPALPPVIPNYRQEVSLYTALPSMMLDYGDTVIGSLHKRVGDEALLDGEDGEWIGPSGGWLRLIADDRRWDAETGGIYRDGPSFGSGTLAAQAGIDLYRDRQDGARNFIGLTLTYGHAHGSVENYDGAIAGYNYFDVWSVGGTWTHYGEGGWYVDGVAQGSFYHARSLSTGGTGIETGGNGAAVSAEGGYPVALGDGWTLEPQLQLIYQALNLRDAADAGGQLRFGNLNSLSGRFGGRATRTWQMEDGRRITGWLLANAWDEFESDAKTAFASAAGYLPFHSDLTGASGEVGAGVNVEVAENFTVYASGSYRKGFDGGLRSFGGTIGVRFNR